MYVNIENDKQPLPPVPEIKIGTQTKIELFFME